MIPKTHKAVVLAHGLWMHRWSMSPIARYLKDNGYNVYRFGYKTTTMPFEFNVQKLQAFVNSLEEETVHLVVHSMGGILSMRAMPKIRKNGKLVMLGSPINGSSVAKEMKKKKWCGWMLKHASEPLENGITSPTVLRESLMISGTSGSIGIGRIITKLEEPHDGTVALVDTEADWINYQETADTNHFRMLFHKGIKKRILRFLKEDTHE